MSLPQDLKWISSHLHVLEHATMCGHIASWSPSLSMKIGKASLQMNPNTQQNLPKWQTWDHLMAHLFTAKDVLRYSQSSVHSKNPAKTVGHTPHHFGRTTDRRYLGKADFRQMGKAVGQNGLVGERFDISPLFDINNSTRDNPY